jgi:hypothetical protein
MTRSQAGRSMTGNLCEIIDGAISVSLETAYCVIF